MKKGEALQWIVSKAKEMRKKSPNKKWQECIKQASEQYRKTHKKKK